jgi:hypothetical protein
MLKTWLGVVLANGVLAIGATAASAASTPTDFGVRTVPGELASEPTASLPGATLRSATRASIDLRSVASLGAQWGRVTSTYRSPAHNRRVGGVRNSFHLSGRAIDIARRPGVTHGQIAAAYRNAGYYLVESLDEGDHSHFAFGSPRYAQQGRPAGRVQQATATRVSPTQWRIVTAASAAFK